MCTSYYSLKSFYQSAPTSVATVEHQGGCGYPQRWMSTRFSGFIVLVAVLVVAMTASVAASNQVEDYYRAPNYVYDRILNRSPEYRYQEDYGQEKDLAEERSFPDSEGEAASELEDSQLHRGAIEPKDSQSPVAANSESDTRPGGNQRQATTKDNRIHQGDESESTQPEKDNQIHQSTESTPKEKANQSEQNSSSTSSSLQEETTTPVEGGNQSKKFWPRAHSPMREDLIVPHKPFTFFNAIKILAGIIYLCAGYVFTHWQLIKLRDNFKFMVEKSRKLWPPDQDQRRQATRSNLIVIMDLKGEQDEEDEQQPEQPEQAEENSTSHQPFSSTPKPGSRSRKSAQSPLEFSFEDEQTLQQISDIKPQDDTPPDTDSARDS